MSTQAVTRKKKWLTCVSMCAQLLVKMQCCNGQFFGVGGAAGARVACLLFRAQMFTRTSSADKFVFETLRPTNIEDHVKRVSAHRELRKVTRRIGVCVLNLCDGGRRAGRRRCTIQLLFGSGTLLNTESQIQREAGDGRRKGLVGLVVVVTVGGGGGTPEIRISEGLRVVVSLNTTNEVP
jgi:hypothetical protein